MGCVTGGECRSSEKPVREVRIESFELSKDEVTFTQWDTCVEYSGCRWVEDERWARNDRPVIHMTWHDAQPCVAWLSMDMGEACRLPSEAEWEYAARTGRHRPVPEPAFSLHSRGLRGRPKCAIFDCH